MPFKMHLYKIIYFFQIKIKICMPSLPKIFKLVTQNTFIFLFGIINKTFEGKIVIIFLSCLSICFNICFGRSKEWSH